MNELRQRMNLLIGSLSERDRDLLMNDRYGPFSYPTMPIQLKEYFNEWLSDCYGMNSETAQAAENIHATYEAYYQHIIDTQDEWEPAQVALARAELGNQHYPTQKDQPLPTN